MLFNSIEFLFLLLPITIGLFYVCTKWASIYAAIWLLLGASVLFYASWSIACTGLLFGSILFNFFLGYGIHRSTRKTRSFLLFAAVGANLSLLFYFKYYNFFLSTVGIQSSKEIILPLGISFFTFTQIAYLVDVYRNEVKEFSLLRYMLFITYFPHLIAGPIIHHKEIMPQFTKCLNFNLKYLNIGVMIFLAGLIKKMLFADSLALICDPLFQKSTGGDPISFMEGWVAALAYTFQLYFDFSGYCDMAIGLSFMVGVRLPINFHSPYKAKNIIDFWRRWHITLSRFLRDYLYIPLGGNRKGRGRKFLNLFATMLIGGIWHGAGWTFIIWGALHGFYLIINHAWQFFKTYLPNFLFPRYLSSILSWGITFISVIVAWVFFRATSFNSALKILKGMFGGNGIAFEFSLLGTSALLLSLVVFVTLLPNMQELFFYYKPALWGRTVRPTTSSLNFPKLFKNYVGDPLLRRGIPFTIYIYALISYILIFFFSYLYYKYNIDINIYRYISNRENYMDINNTEGTFRNNLYSHILFSNNFKNHIKIPIVGSSYTTFMQPKTFKHNGQNYLSASLGIGGNSLLNGFRTAFSIMNQPNIKLIILGVSPLGYAKTGFNSLSFQSEPGEWRAFFSFLGPHFPTTRCSLTQSDYFTLYTHPKMDKFSQFHTFLNYLQKHVFLHDSSPLPIKEIKLTDTQTAYQRIKTQLLAKTPIKVVNENNGEDKTFNWWARGTFDIMQPHGEVFTAFKILKSELDKRNIKLVVYETPTPKSAQAPQIYPPGFFEQYTQRAHKMFNTLGIKYIDLSDFLPWDGNIMLDFIHPDPTARDLIHEYLLDVTFEDSDEL